MKTVHVQTGKPYDILLEAGIADRAGEEIARVHGPCRLCLTADEHTAALFGDRVADSLSAAGFEVFPYVIAAGEKSKNGGELFALLEYAAEENLDRGDLFAALGGGVTGDLTGLAAALYMRGTAFVQLPTSLLAMVDSSVGGKTAVDLRAGKNLCGAFWQPELVLIDPLFLRTLPQREIACGMGEIIKYAVLFDPPLFEQLESGITSDQLEPVIEACVRWKQKTVEQDEFDRGVRQLLNFGHTLGHAVEQASGYALSHGEAVSVGMVSSSAGAAARGICSRRTAQRIRRTAEGCHLPTVYPMKKETVAGYLKQDKKCQKDGIRLSLPREIGHCEPVTMTLEEALKLFDSAGAFL